ncbi:uncharacterized protein LOC126599812 [Malus sylvestris]|uniref:uncharacterized protein LOC126599812 n=1 Tax=Malus sylvestris TaxID=3752 RepID=UPI0021ACF48B|nr:uncharacterized protein LOC126599812 [Malus sylvestris]XP_050122219.1 uncharacterized protein LOC126599812 [Malus sylvestris]
MRVEQPKEKFSDMMLLRKPQPVSVDESSENKQEQSSDANKNIIGNAEIEKWREEENDKVHGFTLLEKPKANCVKTKSEDDSEHFENGESSMADVVEDNDSSKDLSEFTASNTIRNNLEESKGGPGQKDDSLIRLQPYEQSNMESGDEVSASSELSGTNLPVSDVDLSIDTAIQGKPKRLNKSVKEEMGFHKVKTIVSTLRMANLVWLMLLKIMIAPRICPNLQHLTQYVTILKNPKVVLVKRMIPL